MDLNSWKPRLETCHWWFQRGSEPPCGLSRWPLWHWWVWASCLATDWQHGVDLRATDSEEVSVMKGLTLGPGLGAGRMKPHGEEEGVSGGFRGWRGGGSWLVLGGVSSSATYQL